MPNIDKALKGPWRTRRLFDRVEIWSADGTLVTDLTLSIAGDEQHNSEFVANAQLIAAAPDLLSVLKFILNKPSINECMRRHDAKTVEMIEAVIAAAELQ